jgi:hypothetical protein
MLSINNQIEIDITLINEYKNDIKIRLYVILEKTKSPKDLLNKTIKTASTKVGKIR